MEKIGLNVEYTVEGSDLVIKIDLSKDYGRSKSGKTVIVASTQGNKRVGGNGAMIGLNVYKYPE